MIDAIGSEDHFVDHIKPIWLALPERGTFYVRTPRPDIPNTVVAIAPPSRNPTLVAAAGDLKRGRGRRNAMMEHGCGQSFGGDPRTLRWASYAGGEHRDAELFLHPGNHPAGRDRARYPNARVEVVGCAKLDSLPQRDRGDSAPRVAAVSFHWNCIICAETRPAFDDFKRQVAELAQTMTVIGHGHPRIIRRLAAFYRSIGVETVKSFAEVCARADVYINDGSSTLYEFASTGRPVVVLNSRLYRRNINHGLRFWEASTVGVNVEAGGDLTEAVRYALEDPPAQQRERERCVDMVYAYRSGAAQRAADVLMDWAGERVRAVA